MVAGYPASDSKRKHWFKAKENSSNLRELD